MKIVLLLCCLSTTMLLLYQDLIDDNAPASRSVQTQNAYRILNIPRRENGYHNFESMVITTKEDFDVFLKEIPTQIGWNNRETFSEALIQSHLDFEREALVLLRHTEGSGSVQVVFGTPLLQDRTLLVEIRGESLAGGATTD